MVTLSLCNYTYGSVDLKKRDFHINLYNFDEEEKSDTLSRKLVASISSYSSEMLYRFSKGR